LATYTGDRLHKVEILPHDALHTNEVKGNELRRFISSAFENRLRAGLV